MYLGDTMDKKYLMETCKYCGNKGMLKIIGKHEQHVKDYDGDVPIFSMDTLWRLLECPVCKGILLHKSYSDDSMFDPYNNEYFSDESIVYPSSKYTFIHVPENIYKSYEAAVKTSKVDLTIRCSW